MKLQGYAELLNGDYSQEKFLKLSKMLRICSERGYQVIEEETISDKYLAAFGCQAFFH